MSVLRVELRDGRSRRALVRSGTHGKRGRWYWVVVIVRALNLLSIHTPTHVSMLACVSGCQPGVPHTPICLL